MIKSQEDFKKSGIVDPEPRVVDFRQKDRIRNLEYIFGTSSIWRMFMPSARKLQHDGTNWEAYINPEAINK
jgi:hypothetical protein